MRPLGSVTHIPRGRRDTWGRVRARARAPAGSAAASREAPPLWNSPGCDVGAIPASPAGLHTAEEAARARAVNLAARRPWGGRGCRSASAEDRTAGRLPDGRSRGNADRLAADPADTGEEVRGRGAPRAEGGAWGRRGASPTRDPSRSLKC